MEGGDQKRPRLDPSYGPSGTLPRPSQPSPLPPQFHPQRHTSYSEPSPPTQYPPPHSQPPPSQSYPPPPSSGTLEPRAPQPEPPTSLVPRANHGPALSQPTRSYSLDSSYPRPPGTPSQSASAEPQRRPLAIAGNNECTYPPMEYGHPPVYASAEHHIANGNIPHNGLPMANPHEQYGAAHMGPAQSYPPTPVAAYAQPGPYGPAPPNYHGVPRKKQVRATQACNLCRQRKQKCDEARPACTSCRDQGVECQYKDVPPPKQDRTLMQLADGMSLLISEVQSIKADVGILMKERSLESAERKLSPVVSATATPSILGDDRGGGSGYGSEIQKNSSEPTSGISVSAQLAPITTSTSGPVPAPMAAPISVLQDTEQQYLEQSSPNEAPIKQEEPRAADDSGDQTDEAEFALPLDHKTPAHQLLKDWKCMEPFTRGLEGYTEDYPMELEMGRGCLRLYGRGEGSDIGDGAQQVGSPASSATGDDVQAAASPKEGLWGTGMTSTSAVEMRRSESSQGGLNPDGSLKLDERTVRRCVDSFLRHIHMLHPFLDKGRLNKMVERFISRYSPNHHTSRSPYNPVANNFSGPEPYGGLPLKRKRSNGASISGQYNSTSEQSSAGTQYRLPERSISNAIILLVIALGQICEYKQPLPGPVKSPQNVNDGSPHMVQFESPPATIKPSPSTSHSTLTSAPSPATDYHYRFGYGSRRSSLEGLPTFERRDTGVRNVDITPGLAYFAYATDITGNLHGGNELAHAQAALLAGLYLGQLARVLESWSWINTACRVCRVLIEKDKNHLRPERYIPDPKNEGRMVQRPINAASSSQVGSGFYAKMDLLKLAFWTCLQLESDILAELSNLPSSGVSKYENRIALPSGVYLDMPTEAPDDKLNMVYYSAQIHLRKILNRAHVDLYGNKSKSKSKTASWIHDSAPFLKEWLEGWRQSLPPQLAWDGSARATDINNARLRAKYYGAQYIITRPSLYYAIHEMNPSEALKEKYKRAESTPSSTPYSAGPDQDGQAIIENCRQCVQAAIDSTIAFDDVPDRLVVTNIFGTMHAQFSNMLVLAATCDSWLEFLIPGGTEHLDMLFARTIDRLRRLAPLSPTMEMDAKILENTQRYLHLKKRGMHYLPASAHSSFHSHHS